MDYEKRTYSLVEIFFRVIIVAQDGPYLLVVGFVIGNIAQIHYSVQ